MAAVVGVVLGLLVAEVMARAYAHTGGGAGRRIAARDPLGALYEPYGNFGYRQKPGKSEGYMNGTRAFWNSMGYRGPVVEVAKPAGTYRIILLGGSTTAGYGVNDDETIDAHMRRLLSSRSPGACFEVVNLALGGYDSYQDYERMRVDGIRFAPDLVVINSGINDVRNAQYGRLSSPPDPRTLIWEPVLQSMREEARHGPSLSSILLHYSYLARIPGLVLERVRQRGELRHIEVTEPDNSAVDYFEVNVVRTMGLAFEAGAAVILSTPPSALSRRNKPSDPPEKSYWIRDAGTTEDLRRRLAARLSSIAERQRGVGGRVTYIAPRLPDDQFLDDTHLTSAGNRTVAQRLVEAATSYVPASLASAPARSGPCPGSRNEAARGRR